MKLVHPDEPQIPALLPVLHVNRTRTSPVQAADVNLAFETIRGVSSMVHKQDEVWYREPGCLRAGCS